MGHKRVIILVPTDKEAAGMIARGLLVVVCGVGMAECAACAAKVIVEQKPDILMLAGIAGSYGDRLRIGEVVVVGSETIADLGSLSVHDGGKCFTSLYQKTYPAPIPAVEGFRTARGNTLNAAGGLRGLSVDETDAEVENMEGAAFFAVCRRLGVPAVEVRAISNVVGEPIAPENLSRAVESLTAAAEKIVTQLCD